LLRFYGKCMKGTIMRNRLFNLQWVCCVGLMIILGDRGTHAQSTNEVVVWGGEDIGEYDVTNVPPDLTNVMAIAGGSQFCLALNGDGSVTTWGYNDGRTVLPPNLSNVIGIAAGDVHGLALKMDGTVTAWGATNYGQGYGQTIVPAGLSNVIAVAAGGYISMALQNDGLVTVWGDPYTQQTYVPLGLSNVVAISGSITHCLALTDAGNVTVWGTSDPYITNCPRGLTNIVAIAAGNLFSLVVTSDGAVIAWGDNSPATNLPSGLTNVESVAAGDACGLAQVQDGTVVAWGQGPYSWEQIPAPVPFGLENVLAIAAGESEDMAMVGGGFPVVLPLANEFAYSGTRAVIFKANAFGAFPLSYQWQFQGNNILGANASWLLFTNVQVENSGNYTVLVSNAYGMASNAVPLEVVDSPPIIRQQPESLQLPLGNDFTFSVDATGSQPISYQWQFNGADIIGATDSSLTVFNAQTLDLGFYNVAISNGYGAVTSSNASLSFSYSSVVGWGNNQFGQLNLPTNLTDVVAVSAGNDHNLVLYADGTVASWGVWGLVPYYAYSPTGLSNAVAIAAGSPFDLALKSDGTVFAWGDNNYGDTNVPTGLSNVVAIAAGGMQAMALQNNGIVVTWGDFSINGSGNIEGPAFVPTNLSNVVEIAAGASHCLALKSDGTVVAWGDNSSGQTNVPSDLTNVIAIGAGPSALCSLAVRADGSVVGWGSLPGPIPTNLTDVTAVAAGYAFCLALLANRTVVAWGNVDPDFGQTNIPPGLTNVTAIAGGYWDSLVLDPIGGAINFTGNFGGVSDAPILTIDLGPPAALRAGASWSAPGVNNCTAPSANYLVTSSSENIIFSNITGWTAVNLTLTNLTNGEQVTVPAYYVLSIDWPPLPSITYGTPLGPHQLNATTIDTNGNFRFAPTNGNVLNAGTNILSVVFTPDDTNYYGSTVSTNNTLFVLPASLTVTASNVTWVIGQPFPTFRGIVTGLTNQDNLTATFISSATTNSLPGNYQITPILVDTNDRLPNYTVTTNAGNLAIVATPSIQATTQSGNLFSFTWNATSNQTYQIQYTTDLTTGAWTNSGVPVTATNTTATGFDTISNSQKFYRIVLSL
jgi:alpha-tubulin suppressor-like RCC1 family protein